MESFSCKIGKDLMEEYNQVLQQEECLWFPKSRCNWLIEGDKKIKVFHLSMIIRRRRNKVEMLKNNGNV